MPLARDTAIRVSLIGTTDRLHALRTPRGEAIIEVQRIAGRRTDLLAQAAEHFLGAETWNRPSCGRLLVDAGADPELVGAAADRTLWNLRNYGHTSAGTTAPGAIRTTEGLT